MWLDRPEQWEALAHALRKAGEFGLDTETHGQPDKTSPQHRARVHCWSVGVLTTTTSPRGYRRAVGRVLPRAALDHAALRAVLADPSIPKYAHNAPHDRHSLNNEDVEVGGLEDTLQHLRVLCPGLRDYGLKAAEQWALGYGPRPNFTDLTTYIADVVTARGHKEKACICGAKPCRAKTTSDWLDKDGVWRAHDRVTWKVFTPIHRQEERRIAVTEFVPGAALPPLAWVATKKKPDRPGWWKGAPLDRWLEWVAYSAADAIRGMELRDWMRNRKPRDLVYPWVRRAA